MKTNASLCLQKILVTNIIPKTNYRKLEGELISCKIQHCRYANEKAVRNIRRHLASCKSEAQTRANDLQTAERQTHSD